MEQVNTNISNVFIEEIEVDYEHMCMLANSDALSDWITEQYGTSLQCISNNYPYKILMSNQDKIDLERTNRDVFSENRKRIVLSFELNDDQFADIFDGQPNEKYDNYGPIMFNIVKISDACVFIPKNKIIGGEYEDKNMLFVLVSRKDIEKMKEAFKETISKLESSTRDQFIMSARGKNIEITHGYKVDRSFMAIQDYLRIGEMLENSSEVRNFIHLIKSIMSSKSPFRDISGTRIKASLSYYNFLYDFEQLPFIFVCASSGTGKTQLPFSLKIPLLYLIYNETTVGNSDRIEKIQPIYHRFLPISYNFLGCIEKDFADLSKNSIKEDKRIDSDCIRSQKLFTPSFIVYICEQIISIREKYPNEHWTISELKIPLEKVVLKKMTVGEAIRKLNQLFEGRWHLQPIIFLDESQKNGDNEVFIGKYKYTRKIIRLLGFIPVFMGTNAGLANFVSIGSAMNSREDHATPWCYIIHKLAPTCQPLIKNEIDAIKFGIANRYYGNDELIQQAEKFIDVIAKLLTHERPFFCNIILGFLKSTEPESDELWKKCVNNGWFDSLELFEETIYEVFNVFIQRKKEFDRYSNDGIDYAVYNFANISLTQPEYWRKLISEEGAIEIVSQENGAKGISFEKSSGIHNHIAYLYVPDGLKKALNGLNFFGITTNAHDMVFLGYPGEKPAHCDPFEREQIFAPFCHETIGELAFIGSKNFDKIFLGMRPNRTKGDETKGGLPKYQRISTCRAFRNVTKLNKEFNTDARNTSKLWQAQETVVPVSAIIASHYNGFKGVSFDVWLSCFIRELNINSVYSQNVNDIPAIQFPSNDKFWDFYKYIKIPFCSPTLKEDWPKDFIEYIKEYNKYVNGDLCGHIGTVHADLNRESRDFYIRDSLEGTEIISGECKYRSEGTDWTLISGTISKLCGMNSPINFMTLNKSKNNLSNYCWGSIKEKINCNKKGGDDLLRLNLFIYRLKVKRTPDIMSVYTPEYELEPLYRDLEFSTSTSQAVIIIELEKLDPSRL